MRNVDGARLGKLVLVGVAWLALASGCARMPSTGITTLKPANQVELQKYLLDHKPDLDLFRVRGPFAVAQSKDRELLLSSGEHIDADFFLSASPGKAPLVILLHGLDNSKEDHAYQALHLATWGLHCMTLQLPNQGPWTENGKTLARIVEFVRRQPESIDNRIDADRIILAGHSFGGAAAAIALAEGAPATGGILLDPAGVGKTLPAYLRRINKPVMVLAADPKVSVTLDRGAFFRYIRRSVTEVSIQDAAHEDAQYPLELYSSSNEVLKITFVSALTATAFSLGATGKIDYAWTSFRGAIGDGKLVNAKKK